MHYLLVAAVILASLFTSSANAFEVEILPPVVEAKVDIARQQMDVYVHGEKKYTWPVSTGTIRYKTPNGDYQPYRMHTLWHSRKYDLTPMPYAIFFYKGFAVHGTKSIRRLGRPASHGCVRLKTKDAKILFKLVLKHKRARTRISLAGDWNWAAAKLAKRKKYKKKRLATGRLTKRQLRKLRRAGARKFSWGIDRRNKTRWNKRRSARVWHTGIFSD